MEIRNIMKIFKICFGIIFMLFVFVFIVGHSNNKKKQKLKSGKSDSKKILKLSDAMEYTTNAILFIFGFGIVFTFILLLDFSSFKYIQNDVRTLITIIICNLIGGIIGLLLIIGCVRRIIIKYRISNGEYIIVEDRLMDIQQRITNEEDGHEEYFDLYFHDYFKKYNQTVTERWTKKPYLYKEGDKFYLIFVKGLGSPFICKDKNYVLDDEEKAKLRNSDAIEDYVKISKFKLKSTPIQWPIYITKEQIKRDFIKNRKLTQIPLYIFINIFAIILNICSFKTNNAFAIIVCTIVNLFFLYFTIMKINFLVKVSTDIRKLKFKIIEDAVSSLNDGVEFRDSNEMMSLKFNNSRRTVFVDKKYYMNTQIGDVFYLIFVKSEKEAVAFYAKSNSVLSIEK